MESIFITHSIPNGYSWTITSKLGHILRVAEEKYGERDYEYTILGVEFNQDGHPRIWYPGNCKNVIIQISMNCFKNLNRAVYQVAHEVIHCLCPTGGKNANVLEEGLATLFSIEYTAENGHGTWTPTGEKYSDAYKLVKELLSIDPDIIIKLRSKQPTISLIDLDLIIETNSNIPKELAEKLVQKF